MRDQHRGYSREKGTDGRDQRIAGLSVQKPSPCWLFRKRWKKMPKHGELVGHTRWCEECGVGHGPLYSCEHYPVEVKKEIAERDEIFRKNVRSRAWWREQAERNNWDEQTLATAMVCFGRPTED